MEFLFIPLFIVGWVLILWGLRNLTPTVKKIIDKWMES